MAVGGIWIVVVVTVQYKVTWHTSRAKWKDIGCVLHGITAIDVFHILLDWSPIRMENIFRRTKYIRPTWLTNIFPRKFSLHIWWGDNSFAILELTDSYISSRCRVHNPRDHDNLETDRHRSLISGYQWKPFTAIRDAVLTYYCMLHSGYWQK